MARRTAAGRLALVALLVAGAPACRETGSGRAADAQAGAVVPGRLAAAGAHDQVDARARELFARHCALCHGPQGRGDGEAAAWLYPPARDFGLGQFRLVSGLGGGPTVEDLMSTLRRGMPGSAMPPFAWMASEDLESLAHLVLELSADGMVESMHEQAVAEGEPFDAGEARAIAASWLRPGEPIASLPPLEPTPGVLERGRELYGQHCAACHGLDGKGMGGEPKRHEDGSLTWARDFTAGILKGGGSRLDLTRRIRAGLPGSAMPPLDLPRDELAALVAWVQRLIPAGAPERHVQVRTRIVAPYVEAAEPGPEDWRRAEELELRTAPLSWDDLSVLDVRVAAVHNGSRAWVRLRWEDATKEDRPLGGGPWFDAAAVQLSDDPAPPLFGMGDEGHAVNIWHWSAARWGEVAGALDPLDRAPHSGRVVVDDVGRLDVPVYLPIPADAEDATALEAQGFARLGEEALPLRASSRFADGAWEVVFTRALDAIDEREVDLVVGRLVQVAFAVWNGAAGDHRGQKSITIWHELELGR